MDHGGGHRPAAAQHAEVHAVDVFGDEEARAGLGILAVDDAGDVLVRERGEHVRLAAEAVDGVARQVAAHDLDGDADPEVRVVRLVDRRHAAAADPAAHHVAAGEQLAGVVLGGRRGERLQGPARRAGGRRADGRGRHALERAARGDARQPEQIHGFRGGRTI
jgi:hypothetical protein